MKRTKTKVVVHFKILFVTKNAAAAIPKRKERVKSSYLAVNTFPNSDWISVGISHQENKNNISRLSFLSPATIPNRTNAKTGQGPIILSHSIARSKYGINGSLGFSHRWLIGK